MSMKVGVMQPYLFPYVGYFQLIYAVDKFVIYDNIEYTKKGWMNRNRIWLNDSDTYFTVPLKKDSDFLKVSDRYLSDTYSKDVQKIVNRIQSTYGKSPYYKEVIPMIKEVFLFDEANLFKFVYNSLMTIIEYLEIETEIVIASAINIDHQLKSQEKVLAICEKMGADQYINPKGGTELYDKNIFKTRNISLSFIHSGDIVYDQFGGDFVPWLSVIDVLMFNSKETVQQYLKAYTLH